LRFIQHPTDTRSGDQFSPTVTVEVLDQYGNRNTTNVVTVDLNSSGSSFLTGTTSVNSVLGIATFTGVGICGTAGAGYTLTATSAGLTATTSTLFNILLILIGDPVGLAFTTQPGQVGPNIAGQPIVQQPVVAIVDCGGNTVPTTAIVKLEINTAPDPGLVGQLVSITTAQWSCQLQRCQLHESGYVHVASTNDRNTNLTGGGIRSVCGNQCIGIAAGIQCQSADRNISNLNLRRRGSGARSVWESGAELYNYRNVVADSDLGIWCRIIQLP